MLQGFFWGGGHWGACGGGSFLCFVFCFFVLVFDEIICHRYIPRVTRVELFFFLICILLLFLILFFFLRWKGHNFSWLYELVNLHLTLPMTPVKDHLSHGLTSTSLVASRVMASREVKEYSFYLTITLLWDLTFQKEDRLSADRIKKPTFHAPFWSPKRKEGSFTI